MGADIKANTSGAAAHLRLVIFVSSRMAASAVTPLSPMSLNPRLRARGRMGNGERVGVSTGADTKRTLGAGGALEVGDHRLLEDGSEHGGALGPEVIAHETARDGWGQ